MTIIYTSGHAHSFLVISVFSVLLFDWALFSCLFECIMKKCSKHICYVEIVVRVNDINLNEALLLRIVFRAFLNVKLWSLKYICVCVCIWVNSRSDRTDSWVFWTLKTKCVLLFRHICATNIIMLLSFDRDILDFSDVFMSGCICTHTASPHPPRWHKVWQNRLLYIFTKVHVEHKR